MFRQLKDFVSDKEGFACIDAVPAILALIIALAAFLDIFLILKKINVISSTATYIARTIGPQGGALNVAPDYYPGCRPSDNRATTCTYTNMNTLKENVHDMLKAVSLTDDEYNVTITAKDEDGNVLKTYDFDSSTGNGINIDYGNYLEVKLTINYEWKYMSTLLGLNPVYNKSSVRNVLSTFKIRENP